MRIFRLQNEEEVPTEEVAAEAEKPEMPETPKAKEVKEAVVAAVEEAGGAEAPVEKVAEAAVTAVAEVIADPVISAVEVVGEEAAPEQVAEAVAEVVAETAADGSQTARLQVEGLNVGELVTILNQLFAAPATGITLPEDTNETNLMDRLRLLVAQVKGDEEPETLEEFEVPVGVPEEVAAQLKTRNAKIQKRMALLESENAANKKRTLKLAHDSYESKCTEFVNKGQMTPASKTRMMALGKSHSYDLSLLTGFEDIPTGTVVPIIGKAKKASGVKGDPPPVGDEEKDLTQEEIKEMAALYKA